MVRAMALLPLGVAIAGGEWPGPSVIVGGLLCLSAVVLVSVERPSDRDRPAGGGLPAGAEQWPAGAGQRTPGGARRVAGRLRGLGFGLVSGVMFGLFFLFFRSAGAGSVLWPVAACRLTGTVIALGACLVVRVRPVLLARDRPAGLLPMALAAGAIDASANVCYVLATRTGLFGLAVVITALYPGMTVLLARFVLGERMQAIQRAGLILAGVGLVLVTA